MRTGGEWLLDSGPRPRSCLRVCCGPSKSRSAIVLARSRWPSKGDVTKHLVEVERWQSELEGLVEAERQ